MNSNRTKEATILGAFICVGLILFGYLVSTTAIKVKGMDRVVTVKGLAEREVEANIAIWPIKFDEANNDLAQLYSVIESKSDIIVKFLEKNGFAEDEITMSQPSIVDRQARDYGDANKIQFRFTASATITVYSRKVSLVRETRKKLLNSVKRGLPFQARITKTKLNFCLPN